MSWSRRSSHDQTQRSRMSSLTSIVLPKSWRLDRSASSRDIPERTLSSVSRARSCAISSSRSLSLCFGLQKSHRIFVDLLGRSPKIKSGRAHHACNCLHQKIPFRVLVCELLPSGGSQAVILRTAIQFRLLPLRQDKAAGLQTVERRVQGSTLYLQNLGRTLPDSLADAMPVLRSPLQRAQNQ